MFKSHRKLTAAVLLSCACLITPYYAHAEETIEHKEGEPVGPHNSYYWELNVDGHSFAKFEVYDKTTDIYEQGYYTGEGSDTEQFREFFTTDTHTANEKDAIEKSMKYIVDMVGAPASTLNINLKLFSPMNANAGADSPTWIQYDANGKPLQINDTQLTATYLGKMPYDEDIGLAEITVNEANEWYTEKFPLLPSNGTNSDYYGTITHEMFHALGLGTHINKDTEGKVVFGAKAEYTVDGQTATMDVFNKYEMGIRDVFGRVAYYSVNESDTSITYDDEPINPNDATAWNRIYGELKSRVITPITIAEYDALLKEKAPLDDKLFYVLRDNPDDTNPKISTNCGAYFTGKNVNEVLTINGQVAQIAWPDGSEMSAVPGLPLNGYERATSDEPELSHIELQNSMMSHQAYRNWCTFLEAEIALLQDLGYTIEREKYFGKSIYNSGTEANPFTYTNTNGFDSDKTHGIGLHVYGSYVDVTQAAKINTTGDYGIGIRLDGVGNKVNIDSDIYAKGEGVNGLLVAYGKKHEVTLNAGKTIEATGADGVAARFDFGSNELSDYVEYRGSYIQAKNRKAFYGSEDATWTIETNAGLLDDINGELVTNFNVAGILKGSAAAIYISPNAYVKNINILQGAVIEGNIISEWNPDAIIYQNGNTDDLEDYQILKPALPYDENGDREEGLTHLNFGCKNGHDGNLVADPTFKMELNDNITGKESLVIDLWGGELITSGINDVNIVHVAEDYTDGINEPVETIYTNEGDLTIESSLIVDGSFVNKGKLQASFDEDGESLKISGTGSAQLTGTNNTTGTFVLNAEQGFYKGTTYIDLVNGAANAPEIAIDDENILVNSNSASLKMSAEFDGTDTITITTLRDYTSLSSTSGESQLAEQLALKADDIAKKLEYTGDPERLSPLDQKWHNLITGIDYNDSTGATAKQALKALTPHVYNSSAQATLNTHTMLNNLNMLGNFSNNVPAARTGGGRGPAADSTPKHNNWRNIVVPFSSYTDQHNGVSSYTNHNSGVLGAMERTLDNGLTHGYHAAVNHQSTSSANQRIKGEGFYLGTHASYAPADWKGWQVFGSARLGLENMRSHRNFVLGGGSFGRSDADWTGFSGSLTVGTALEKEHGVVKSGPFAALGYSFAHRPSVDEHGGGIPAHLDGATYDSLQTQLGYRLTTAPKALDSYDSTKWQAHASVAWNHELLNDNGSTDFALEGLSKSMNDKTADYGRDSMSIAAGVTFKTPKRLDVGLTLGSDIYRHGGSSVYGKVNFEWKF